LLLLCSEIQRLRPAVNVLQQGDFSRVSFLLLRFAIW
jgi:hypothetical protein